MKQAFQDVLIPDLSPNQFADMFAQTVAYGLFTARVHHDSDREFSRADAAREIPRSNPFLRSLLGVVSGPALDDEPFSAFVDDLVGLLNDCDMEAILAEFGRKTGWGDPIFHFYETFLREYDPKERELRGVYFTPSPVVHYIVRSIDETLKSHFGLADGLSSRERTTFVPPSGPKREIPRVLVLDPATGTGSFLYAVVDLIRRRLLEHGQAGRWPSYVREDLLPRLFGFELLVAPYVVAHLKLTMQLAGKDLSDEERKLLGYELSSDERLGIFLTNTLEQGEKQTLVLGKFISDEANEAADVKQAPIMVVLGNPPYSGHSANASSRLVRHRQVRRGGVREVWAKQPTWIGEILASYFSVDGQPLREPNRKWLQDDYVKFIRFGQWRIEESGEGILAFITNNGYLDNPTFRGMRQELCRSFTDIYVLNLHGSVKKKERTPAGDTDQNVFDIQQGVAIGVFIRRAGESQPARVYYADLWGNQGTKYDWLEENTLFTTDWTEVQPEAPLYLFTPVDKTTVEEYEAYWPLDNAFQAKSLGILTKRDFLAVGRTQSELRGKLNDFIDPSESPADTARRFGLPLADQDRWDLATSKRALAPLESESFKPILYRPFDTRVFYDDSLIVARRNTRVLSHLDYENVALCVGRQGAAAGSPVWDAAWSTDKHSDQNLFRRGGATVFPLWLYGTVEGSFDPQGRVSNLAPEFVHHVAAQTGLTVTGERGDWQRSIGHRDIIEYVYAVLHSLSYRVRYGDLLGNAFPRVPVTRDVDLFQELSRVGSELFDLHISNSGRSLPLVRFPVRGSDRVDEGFPVFVPPASIDPHSGSPTDHGRVYINGGESQQPQYFEGISVEVWEFTVGGYPICSKWLKDRRGEQLSGQDQDIYMNAVSSIVRTLEIQEEVDTLIPGWPLT